MASGDPPALLSWIADFASIVSVGLTLYLTKTALKVKREFDRAENIPTHAARLQERCLEIDKCLNDYSTNRRDLTPVIGTLQGDLKWLDSYLTKSEKATLNVVNASLIRYTSNENEPNLRILQRDLYQLRTDMENLARRVGRV